MDSDGRTPDSGPELKKQPSLDTLPVAGFTRRRIAVLVAGLVVIWLVGVFARQVGDASQAASQVDTLRERNLAVERQIAALKDEVALTQRPEFIAQMARGYGLGSSRERTFTVNTSSVDPSVPGSTGIAAVVEQPARSPLEAWLQVLFGRQAGQ